MMDKTNTAVREKGRAVLLAAMMVLSVVAMSAAFAGGVAAANERYENSENPVNSGDTLFQGEDEFVLEGGDFVDDTSLVGVSGNAEGELLDLNSPILEDQTTGRYSVGGSDAEGTNYVYVQTPRVTDLTVTNLDNDDGSDISDVDDSSISSTDAENMRISVNYNFDEAEKLEVVVEDESGSDITQQVLQSDEDDMIETSGGNVMIDLSNEDAGEYTITAQGSENLDFGSAVRTTTVDVATDDDLSLELSEDTATRGDNVQYTVTGGTGGAYHLVAIEESDFRDNIDTNDKSKMFRNIDDTEEVGYESDENGGVAWATVEMDGMTAVGSIETQYLDDSSVDIDVYEAYGNSDDTDAQVTDLVAGDLESEDDVSLDVETGEISIENPDGTYVVGSEIDVNGTATSADEVAIFARDNSGWELVEENIGVDSDDTFEEEDITLSDTDYEGSDILSLAGTYRFGVIDQADANEVKAETGTDDDGNYDIGTSDFNQGTSTSTSLRVVEGDLTVDHVSLINGQVADGESISIRGTAPGKESVSVSFYGPRGTYDRVEISTDSEYVFEEEDIQVGNNLGPLIGTDTDISQGPVYMSVYSTGRDNVPGDGSVDGIDGIPVDQQFVQLYQEVNENQLSQQQLLERIASETTRDTGSDDISRTFQFRYTDPQTRIESVSSDSGGDGVVVAGETMTVTGVTNRQPDDNTISVEVIDDMSDTQFDIASTDQWKTDGQWNVTLDTTNVKPGNYTVKVDDGDSTDRTDIWITEEREDVDAENTDGNADDGGSDTSSDDDRDDMSGDGTSDDNSDSPSGDDTSDDDGDDMSDDNSDGDGTPGFGLPVAVVALLAAVLALRRDTDSR